MQQDLAKKYFLGQRRTAVVTTFLCAKRFRSPQDFCMIRLGNVEFNRKGKSLSKMKIYRRQNVSQAKLTKISLCSSTEFLEKMHDGFLTKTCTFANTTFEYVYEVVFNFIKLYCIHWPCIHMANEQIQFHLMKLEVYFPTCFAILSLKSIQLPFDLLSKRKKNYLIFLSILSYQYL